MGCRRFVRMIGIDYSGAETADPSLKGLRVRQTVDDAAPEDIPSPVGPKNTGRGGASRTG